MLKISRNRLGEYNKSCSTPHPELRKIEFAFFWFSYNFLGILQVPATWLYYWSFTFPHRPPELFNTSQQYPSLAHRLLERSQSSHPYPPAAGWARRRRRPADLDQQAARDPLGAHLGSIGGVGRRGWGSGEGARRWPRRLLFRRGGAQCQATSDDVSHYGFLGGDLDEWKARGEGRGEVHRATINGGRGGAGWTAAAWRTHEGSERP
jgi:hypothetical protein